MNTRICTCRDWGEIASGTALYYCADCKGARPEKCYPEQRVDRRIWRESRLNRTAADIEAEYRAAIENAEAGERAVAEVGRPQLSGTPGRCGTCRHWERPKGKKAHWTCQAVVIFEVTGEVDAPCFVRFLGWDGDAEVACRSDFGCTLWGAKP